MSSNQEIGAPFTLASLPRPINASGRTQATGVYSISGPKKRKRTEVAVGVDGEGILIYSVQNPRLVTSYALPPQTAFAIPPYSLYFKSASKKPVSRFTYAAIARSGSTGAQVLCFAETIRKDGTTDTVKSSYITAGTVIAIDSVSSPDGSHDVLIIFEDGQVNCLSSNLATKRWDTQLRASPSDDGVMEVEHVASTTGQTAVEGLLRNREDIAALLGSELGGKSDILNLIPVVCVVFRQSNHERIVSLFQIQPRSSDLITSQLVPVKHLLTWELKTALLKPIAPSSTRQYHLHISTGILHVLAGDRLISYDLSGTVPKIYSDLDVPNMSIGSFLRISPDLVITASPNSYGIYDVKYCSVQALRPFEQIAEKTQDTKKRKLSQPDVKQDLAVSPKLVTYSHDLKVVVGISNHELIGIQLGGTTAHKRVKTNGSLLINSIGRGIISAPSAKELADWKKRAHKLGKHASKGRVAEFEESFAADLGIDLSSDPATGKSKSKPQHIITNGSANPTLTNGVNGNLHETDGETISPEKELQEWQLPSAVTEAERYRYRHKAIFALGAIFRIAPLSLEKPGKRPLKIVFFPPNVFQWLLLSGYVTKESIRRAVMESEEHFESPMDITDGDIIAAIADFDPELHILSAVLNQGHFLPVGEVVQAIKVLIQSLDDQPDNEAMPRLLTDGSERPEEKMDVDADLDSELDAATHDLDHALTMLDSGLLIRSHTLRPALIRLHTFPPSAISSTLRSMMPRQELESLVRLLHSELRHGGWTSAYDFLDSDLNLSTEDPDNRAVAIIASLLSCSLDAIGTGAWLSTGGSVLEEAKEEIIHDLLFDTSEALNGFWEARFMRGLFSEFLRYASNIPKTQKPSNQRLQKQGKPFAADGLRDEELPMLPLGGKPDMGIQKTKTGKGGRKEERSAREIGMLISKRVPKYSFERIVL